MLVAFSHVESLLVILHSLLAVMFITDDVPPAAGAGHPDDGLSVRMGCGAA